MKILSAQLIREGDAYTIKHEPIASEDLMERAGETCFQWIYDRAPNLFPNGVDERDYKFIVFCGPGNNGGDGLVIARMLRRHGYEVEVIVVEFSDKTSKDFDLNLKKLEKSKVQIQKVRKVSDLPKIEKDALVIDALFGTGLTRPAEGIASQAIQAINCHSGTVVAIDMPSGLFDQDNFDNNYDAIVNATYTLTFQFPKLAFLLGENFHKVGQYFVLDIRLHPDFVRTVQTPYFVLGEADVQSMYKSRSVIAHKGTFGHALVVAGSEGKYGAAVLSAQSALRSGAGLVSVRIPRNGAVVMHTSVHEAMVIPADDHEYLSKETDYDPYQAVGAGPGMGTQKETAAFLKQLLQNVNCPLVLDADAINLIAQEKDLVDLIPQNSILTPHPGELRRLIGDWKSDFDRLQKQIKWAQNRKVYLLCKGARSSIATPEGRVYFNETGNPGMATGGSGDVLTGIITALLAQKYSSFEAVALGVFLHGKAGDMAAEYLGYEALIASDITDHLGKAFLSVNLPAKQVQ